MPPLRTPPTHSRALVAALIILTAACATSAPESGSPHTSTSSAIQRLVVVSEGDGALYRIDLDPHAPHGRTITHISGASVRQGESMLLDGHRLVVADFHGLSLINLSDDAQHATTATPIRDPAFHETFSAARVADRYLTVSSAIEGGRPPYTVLSVPAPI
jgi:hypothetical protein